jgi:hypothetical protein
LPESRRGVELLFQWQDRDLTLLEVLNNVEELAERTPQPVQADHGQAVIGAQVVEEISEDCPLEGLAGDHVLEHPVRSGGLEAAFLAREILVTGGNAGIA